MILSQSQWIFAVLLYLLIGQVFSLVYTLNYRPDKNAMLGLMGLFWPLILVLDLILHFAGMWGKSSALFAKKVQPKQQTPKV